MFPERRSAWGAFIASLLVHVMIASTCLQAGQQTFKACLPEKRPLEMSLARFQALPPAARPVKEQKKIPEIKKERAATAQLPHKPETAVVEKKAESSQARKKPSKQTPKKVSQAAKKEERTIPPEPGAVADAVRGEGQKAESLQTAKIPQPSEPAGRNADEREREENLIISKLLALINQERFYPYQARRLGLRGAAEITVCLSAGGSIEEYRVDSASHELFARTAMQIMDKVAGRKELQDSSLQSRIRVTVPIVFELSDR